MSGISAVYDLPELPSLKCTVGGRLALPDAVIEIHHYDFRGSQTGTFSSPRAFLDLALSPRPGDPRGVYGGAGQASARRLGDIIFVPAGEELATRWGAGQQMSICCGFDRIAFGDEGSTLSTDALDASLDVRSAPVRGGLVRLAREIESPGFASELLAEAIWTEISIELVRYLRRAAAGGEVRNGLTPVQLRRIEEALEAPGKLPGAAQLAALCGLSTRHFFRLFRATTGTTLAGYAAARRIERAKRLLATPRPPVKEVAWRCGFETSAAFSAAFRKAVGVTPKEYRVSMLQ